MRKPLIERLEMDLLIERPGESPVVVEIKTDNGAAAIQQGLGQLLLYGGLYRRHPEGSVAELILLIPNRLPSTHVAQVLAEYGVRVLTYEDLDPPVFSREFLEICRLSEAAA